MKLNWKFTVWTKERQRVDHIWIYCGVFWVCALHSIARWWLWSASPMKWRNFYFSIFSSDDYDDDDVGAIILMQATGNHRLSKLKYNKTSTAWFRVVSCVLCVNTRLYSLVETVNCRKCYLIHLMYDDDDDYLRRWPEQTMENEIEVESDKLIERKANRSTGSTYTDPFGKQVNVDWIFNLLWSCGCGFCSTNNIYQ